MSIGFELKSVSVTFKSKKQYYLAEKNNTKNNTVREVDWDDDRFHHLWLMDYYDCMGKIEVQLPSGQSFERRIRHICWWKGLVIITWGEE